MSDRPVRKLYRGTLTNALATLYTSPTNGHANVTLIDICNTDASTVNVTIKLGGKFLFDAQPVAASDTVTLETERALHGGELLEGFASTTAVVDMHAYGRVIGGG
jgi:hypothetical protein